MPLTTDVRLCGLNARTAYIQSLAGINKGKNEEKEKKTRC